MNNVHIGKSVILDLMGSIDIMENSTIALGTAIISHIDAGKSCLKMHYKTEYQKTIIGRNCYIGANCTILMGTKLGENCLVAAGSVVTKSFPPNSFIAGVPAELKKKSVMK